ncbi:hypothetical protein OIU78_001327 [Salix suchowensis]|nr:hypothetical protein OIU78_001327 [Salix suchowensis]
MNGESRRWDNKDSRRSSKKQKLMRNAEEELESKFGFDLFTEGDKRLGWLLTLSSSSLDDEETGRVYSCVDLYFVSQDGSAFKSKYKFRPYFYAATKEKMEMDVEGYLRRRYESQIVDIEIVKKEDLDLESLARISESHVGLDALGIEFNSHKGGEAEKFLLNFKMRHATLSLSLRTILPSEEPHS